MISRGILGAAALLSLAQAQNVNNVDGGDDNQLLDDVVQVGSTFDGTDAFGASDDQAASRISTNNFINFCSGETVTNGLQITEGSCNGIRKFGAQGAWSGGLFYGPRPQSTRGTSSSLGEAELRIQWQ